MKLALCAVLLGLMLNSRAKDDTDSDRDGLPDFHETHKYFTDPARADSDGDGIPDGDWSERREYAYTIRTVLRVMPPYNIAAMTDDYQDARVLEERPDCLEAEIIHYPFNTCAKAITSDPDWRSAAAGLADDVTPGITTNWDAGMRAALTEQLRQDGIDLAALSDKEVAEQVSRWAMKRAEFEDSFTTFAVDFPNGKARIAPGFESSTAAALARTGRTLEEQWDRELFGKGMFETRWRGTCTSSAVYLATCLKAAGLPTRIVICIPAIDASDPDEVRMLAGLTHHGVRRIMERSAQRLGDSWASHTFNEVYVGGRWRRLNYERLGQNILDEGVMGLMTHVNTFRDLADAGLAATWGLRNARHVRDDVFAHSNPYSCIAISDEFGAHCTLANPEPASDGGEYHVLTISRVVWYHDQKRPNPAQMRLDDPDTAGHLVMHVEEGRPGEGPSQFAGFYGRVGKEFVLRAEGHPDLRAYATRGYWVKVEEEMKDFYLRIDPDEFARMPAGVAYRLVAPDSDQDRWVVRPEVTITRTAAPPVTPGIP